MRGENEQRTFVVGDVHLTRSTPAFVSRDLARLLRANPGARFLLAGDFFDLATDAPTTPRQQAIGAIFGAHPDLRRAFAELVDGGGSVTFLGGNHDAALGEPEAASDLADELGLVGRTRARVTVRPWFLRLGGVHVEHGHMYDPDNAPAHPLVDGGTGLGVHFSTEFIHPTEAHRFMHRNDAMPLELFLAAWRWYGARTPAVVVSYFRAAFAALGKAGPFFDAAGHRAVGGERHARYAEEVGVPTAIVDAVFAVGVPSTLDSWTDTFARLYFDRVFATLGIAGGAAAIALGGGRSRAGWLSLGAGALTMAASWKLGRDRYGGTVGARLVEAAARLGAEAGAELVVFGHAHRETLVDGYANTGSFTWPSGQGGRPYLELVGGTRPTAVRCTFV